MATPFTEDFALDLDALQEVVRFLISRGVRTGHGAILVGGAGGEHPLLSIEERKKVMSAGVEAAQGEVPVVTSIQHTDVRLIEDMARHASNAGLDAVQLSPTYYYPCTEGDALRLFERVAKVSDTPIMAYHTWFHGLHMSIDLLHRLAEIENVRALKWSTADAGSFREGIAAMADELVVFNNSDEIVLAHMLGARGFIAHVGGCWPDYSVKMWDLMEQGDYATVEEMLASFKLKWRKWVGKVVQVTSGEGPIMKAPMEEVGLPVGPPRPPAIRPPEYLMAELREIMKSAGVPKARVAETAAR
jgi:4-hydroxy-tetrahydrodipicolinate synthase